MKSVINNKHECYLCGGTLNLDIHHCLFGTANRKKCDEDKLVVTLCHRCHQDIHNQNTWEKRALQKIAQEKYEEKHTRDEFIKRYGKSYL